MGKRSDFERVERDYYQTPYAAVLPLVPFLPERRFTFAEPCAGDGRLANHFYVATNGASQCRFECDIDPQAKGMLQKNALFVNEHDVAGCDLIITNPPWDRSKKSGYLLHKMITHFSNLKPTWLLFDADWQHTAQAVPYLDRLVASVAIGRVKWIEDSKMTGKDNVSWNLFHTHARQITSAPVFFGRNVLPYAGFVDSYMDAYADLAEAA